MPGVVAAFRYKSPKNKEENMCCMLTALLMVGPRLAIVVWWLVRSSRFADAFNSILWPIAGLIFAPWTTLAYVLVFRGGVVGLDWLWIALGIILDLGALGGGYRNRDRIRG
jgi:hypothetical protein